MMTDSVKCLPAFPSLQASISQFTKEKTAPSSSSSSSSKQKFTFFFPLPPFPSSSSLSLSFFFYTGHDDGQRQVPGLRL